MQKGRAYISPAFFTAMESNREAPRPVVNCPILCGQYKKEALVGKIEF